VRLEARPLDAVFRPTSRLAEVLDEPTPLAKVWPSTNGLCQPESLGSANAYAIREADSVKNQSY